VRSARVPTADFPALPKMSFLRLVVGRVDLASFRSPTIHLPVYSEATGAFSEPGCG